VTRIGCVANPHPRVVTGKRAERIALQHGLKTLARDRTRPFEDHRAIPRQSEWNACQKLVRLLNIGQCVLDHDQVSPPMLFAQAARHSGAEPVSRQP